MTPSARAPWRTRPAPSHCWAWRKPSPSSPTRWLDRHAHVLQHDLPRLVAHHGLVLRGQLHAGRVHVDDEAGNAAVRALGAVGRRHQLHEVGVAGAGDEALDAVDDVMVAVADGDGAHAARIGAGIGLGLGEAGFQLAAHRRQQILLLHLAGERIENGAHARPGDVAHAARRQRDASATARSRRPSAPAPKSRRRRIPRGCPSSRSRDPWRAGRSARNIRV